MDTFTDNSLSGSGGERPGGRKRLWLLFIAIAGVLSLAALFIFFSSPQLANMTEPPFVTDGVFLVCLDAGHGGGQPGALSVDGTRMEKDDNLALALAVRDILLENDMQVLMTREGDDELSLDERCQIANDARAAVFVSLHRNSGGGTGVEVWIASQADSRDKKLGKEILDRLAAAGTNNNRGLRKGTANNSASDYAVIRGTEMPACIIEVGFIDSQSDNDVFDTNFKAYAAAIAEGIISLK